MNRESIVFYRSWYESIMKLPVEYQLEIFTALFEYGLNGSIQSGLSPVSEAILGMIIPQIDANNRRYENGKRGGRPPKPTENQTETKKEPNNNLTITKEKPNNNLIETKEKPTENQTETKPKPNVNVYVNDNVNVNANVKKEITSNEVMKKENLSSQHQDKVDFDGLMDFYNRTFNGKLPTILRMTDQRKRAVKARVAQYGKQAVFEVLTKVSQSTFLQGGNKENWKCDFDWIFKQANFTKIYEGNYDYSRQNTSSTDEKRKSARNLKELSAAVLESTLSEED